MRKNKGILIKNSKHFRNGCHVYDAIKIAMSFVDGNVVMNLLPTVHAVKNNGTELDRFEYQNIVNSEISTLYNKQMNEKIDMWIQKAVKEWKADI